jgi:fluoroquinolone transport system ATP-binding protein
VWFYEEVADPVIRVDELRFRYPGADRDAVDGISFEVPAGEIFGLLGPNGAGKSTTQQLLVGQLTGYQGSAEVLGRPVARWGADLYRRIGVGFELPAAFPKLTARENLSFFARLYGAAALDPAEALELVDLGGAADQRVATFSKGMKMRLNLARALLHRPELLFLDEPTSGLDPGHAAAVHAVIRAQADAGRTVFLTTHDMATVAELCDRVAFVRDGRVAAIDTPRALRLAHGQPRVVVEHRVDGQLRRAEFPLTHPTDPELVALLRRAAVETIHTREASLRDVFVAVTAAGRR